MAKATPKNVVRVLENLKTYALAIQADPHAARNFCNDLNAFLDGLSALDAFGTEGQLDPRGDQRDG